MIIRNTDSGRIIEIIKISFKFNLSLLISVIILNLLSKIKNKLIIYINIENMCFNLVGKEHIILYELRK